MRELRQDHRDGIPGSNPIEFYDDPLPVQGAPDRPPWEGLGIQYQRRREAQEKEPESFAPASSPPKASSVQQEEGTAAASSAAPAKGQTASGWRPTPRSPKVKLVPREPNYPPPGHGLTEPPFPAPDKRPEEFVLTRDRQPERQHPPGPPRSARLTQARSGTTTAEARGRTTERRSTKDTAAQGSQKRSSHRGHSDKTHSKRKGARRRKHSSHRRVTSFASESPRNKSPLCRVVLEGTATSRRDLEELGHQCRPLKLTPDKYSKDPKSNTRR